MSIHTNTQTSFNLEASAEAGSMTKKQQNAFVKNFLDNARTQIIAEMEKATATGRSNVIVSLHLRGNTESSEDLTRDVAT